MSDSGDQVATSSIVNMSAEICVVNRYGIHARPAALLVKTASMFKSDITIEKGDMRVSGKSIMGLMTLEAGLGSKVRVIAEGIDAADALEAIRKLFEQKFFEE